MIVLEWLFLTIAPCDAAEPGKLGSQDAATSMMQGMTVLDFGIFFFLILCLVFVSWILARAVKYLNGLLSVYTKLLSEVVEWNKKFNLPILFSYSWLKGVKIEVKYPPKKRIFYFRGCSYITSSCFYDLIREGLSFIKQAPLSHKKVEAGLGTI